MSINVLFRDTNYNILPKQKEVFDKYCKILAWGRRNPTRFLEQFIGLSFTDHQKYILLSSWIPSNVVWVCSRSSGKATSLDTKVWSINEEGIIYSKTVGELKIGDRILDSQNELSEVIHLNPIIFEEYYEVEFSDGEIIKCNGEHLWIIHKNDSQILLDTNYIYKNKKNNFCVPLNKKAKISTEHEYKTIVDVRKINKKIPMRCITMNNKDGSFLCGDNFTVTHNSFMISPFIMAKSLLFPSFKTYIMGPTGQQAQETFMKLENIAKNNIASVVGVSSVFLDEAVRMNAKADPFTHDKSGFHVELFNGSEVNTLNSVAKNIVGIRSNLNVYDEAGKIPRDFYALTLPFTVQNRDFIAGGDLDISLYPKQLQNQNILLSSAEGIDSELYDRYKLGFVKMLMGDPEYFVCDLDCSHSLHPFMDGKPIQPLLKQADVDDAFKVNPYRAAREYNNRFDTDGGEDVLVKRSTITKYSVAFNPVYKNDGTKKYIITYDPAAKLDNSVILISELFRDEAKGLMLRFVNCVNLIEILKNGEKAIIQYPQQIERLKQIILDYNSGFLDYDGIDYLLIDAGSGGGGTQIAQYLMNEWYDKHNKTHRGFIDLNDDYMKLREDDYIGNATNLHMFNFKKDKVTAYQNLQDAVNQGLIVFPKDLNVRAEIEFEETDAEGNLRIRYEKASREELNSLTQFSLMKEELIGMQKIKKPNGTIQFDLSPEAKQRNLHD